MSYSNKKKFLDTYNSNIVILYLNLGSLSTFHLVASCIFRIFSSTIIIIKIYILYTYTSYSELRSSGVRKNINKQKMYMQHGHLFDLLIFHYHLFSHINIIIIITIIKKKKKKRKKEKKKP